MKNTIRIHFFGLALLMCSCHKDNMDTAYVNEYGGMNGRLVLWFGFASSLPAQVTVEGTTFSVSNYWPDGTNGCDDDKLPHFILSQGYHTYSVVYTATGKRSTGTVYIKRRSCNIYQIDSKN